MTNIFEQILSKIPNWEKRYYRISLDIASQIAEILKKKGVQQKEFAKKLNKKESEVSKWLNGDHNFTIKTIAKIEDVLNEDIIIIPKFAHLHDNPYLKAKKTTSSFVVIYPDDSIRTSLSDENTTDFFIKDLLFPKSKKHAVSHTQN